MRTAALLGSLALLPLATACTNGKDSTAANAGKAVVSVTAAPAAGVEAPARVEVIANLTGCKVSIRTEADELRVGVCHTKKADYAITTFPEERFKQTWLDTASMYGGKYLVGSRWVISAPENMLKPFRAKLGGTIQQLQGMGPRPSAS
ncbi:hypothetical protein [Streptomyces sp. NBC_00687]|uniref:hypothetical protein n=1 Tax=Streptomyces sp. NBC_00687 TaxID=2975807 RepID=UPI002250E504|nr:hypothetical protein [Streptomyces sp. NBC_00687]MCX4920013.1 hypothetical protein [Streptomyces sp. NBC_00687]